MCRVLTPSIVKLYEADKARECELLMTLHTGVCPKLVSVGDNTDTDMLVKDHVETTDLSCLTHVRYDKTNTFRLAHKEGKANTEQMKVANQDGLAHVGIDDNKGEVDTKPGLTIDLAFKNEDSVNVKRVETQLMEEV